MKLVAHHLHFMQDCPSLTVLESNVAEFALGSTKLLLIITITSWS